MAVDFNGINSSMHRRADTFLDQASRDDGSARASLRGLEQQAELDSVARSEYEILQGISIHFWKSIFASLKDGRGLTNIAVG